MDYIIYATKKGLGKLLSSRTHTQNCSTSLFLHKASDAETKTVKSCSNNVEVFYFIAIQMNSKVDPP